MLHQEVRVGFASVATANAGLQKEMQRMHFGLRELRAEVRSEDHRAYMPHALTVPQNLAMQKAVYITAFGFFFLSVHQ